MGKIKNSLNAGFSVFLLAVLAFVLFNRQYTLDWLSLINYTPPENIKLLADASSMSEKSRRIFYVHKPEILESSEFNKYCTENEETIVLGCYDGVRIYLFNVTDPRLEGIEEVTAAHEMLHAQYDRLSNSEKSKVNKLLEIEIAKLNDERIIKNLEAYRKKDPTIVLNEAHSILATEVKILNPELEEYYKKYFFDRKKVVSISESYESVFTNIKNQVERYDTELRALKEDIDYREKDLENRATELITWSNKLDELRKAGFISDYNAQISPYNKAVDSYRKDVNILRQKISIHNELVVKRNELAMQQNQLYQSIDSQAKDL